eukprot:6585118-Heterocapsa_arctica.AAC.1
MGGFDAFILAKKQITDEEKWQRALEAVADEFDGELVSDSDNEADPKSPTNTLLLDTLHDAR